MVKPPNSQIANNYVSFVNKAWKSPSSWLASKREDDNAEGLWRVHDTLYDLKDFVKQHPGGSDWLILTKGTDITEAFETHHLQMSKCNAVLKKYKVRQASLPRNIKFTFHDDGFYRTLKRRVVEKLGESELKSSGLSHIYTDALLLGTFFISVLSTRIPWLFLLAALLMSYVVLAAHSYIHRKDNFRMYYFNLSFMSFREWRVSHALSHHLFTNSLVDMEMMLLEPFFCWLPDPTAKGFINRYVSWAYGPVIYALFFVMDILKRFVGLCSRKESLANATDFIPFSLPIAMYIFAGNDIGLFVVLKLWLGIVCLSSFIFALIGVNAGHHHPESFHDGDAIRQNLDWGVYQVDTMIDRTDLKGNHLLALTHFGDHILHHLFPTLDHDQLHMLYPVLNETVKEFQLEVRTQAWPNLIVGQHQQLARIVPSERLLKK